MPTMTSTNSETVCFRGGLAVSLRALQLLWQFEERGCVVRVAPDGLTLHIGPRQLLTEEDRIRIREHRDELFALVRYCDDSPRMVM